MRHVHLLIALLLPLHLEAVEPVHVAVAANFRSTLAALNPDFESRTGYTVRLTSASTGILYSQIVHGAPFDLFLAADARTPHRLAQAGRGDTFCYAMGSLVLVGGSGSLDQLADPTLSVAIANPETAPYGEAARQVLSRKEFAAGESRRLIRANNVAQAYQIWHVGGAPLALVARALARGATLVPAAWHSPLEQHAILLDRGRPSEAALAYSEWLRSDRVRTLITESGYDPCP
jgi:molybdate transport system substrate-binding protein